MELKSFPKVEYKVLRAGVLPPGVSVPGETKLEHFLCPLFWADVLWVVGRKGVPD